MTPMFLAAANSPQGLEKHLAENIDEIFEFEINSEHIIKLQVTHNFITIYTSDSGGDGVLRALRCCVIDKKHNCPKFVVRSDEKHLGTHRSLDELDIMHYHLHYDCVKQIPNGYLKQVLNSLVNHRFIEKTSREECMQAYKYFLSEMFPDGELGEQGHHQNAPDQEMNCFPILAFLSRSFFKHP